MKLGKIMCKPRSAIVTFAFAILTSSMASAAIKKVTLFVNHGSQAAIRHEQAIQPFKNVMRALAQEKGFTLTISEKDSSAALKSAALNNLKSQDVVLFANIGQDAFTTPADQALIQSFFMDGGKAMGFHASIDHHSYWKWWEDLHNGSGFQGHKDAAFQLIEDAEMSRMPILKKMWDDNKLGNPYIGTVINTEVYTLNVYPKGKVGVTVMQTVAPPNNDTRVPSHDFTWHKKIGNGEYIYTCLGHKDADFTGGWLQKAIWANMQYLNGFYNVTRVNGKETAKSNSIDFMNKKVRANFNGPYSLTVRNVRGEVVLLKSSQGTGELDLSKLQPGFYMVKAKSSTGSQSLKAIIN